MAKLLQLPDMPEIPEPLRGNSFAVLSAAILGDQDFGDELIRAAAASRAADGHLRDDAPEGAVVGGHGP